MRLREEARRCAPFIVPSDNRLLSAGGVLHLRPSNKPDSYAPTRSGHNALYGNYAGVKEDVRRTHSALP